MNTRIIILLGALFLAMSAGCAHAKLANQCRYIDDDGLAKHESVCFPRKAGEYIVSLGSNTETSIIADIYGRYGILSTTQVQVPESYGKQYVRLFLLVVSDDPGPEKMFEIAADATGFFRPYVNVTPNRTRREDTISATGMDAA